MFPHRRTLALGILLGLSASFVSFVSGRDMALVGAAREQVGRTVGYDPAYRKIAYPGGDLPLETGVCTDVVIRAFRSAHGLDLQKLVHEDMKSDFRAYPQIWGLKGPDRNIDHRRVPNLQTYFKRRGWSRPIGEKAADFEAGDIVTCLVAGNRPHIMIVSDRIRADGTPLVIHNIGAGAHEEEGLFSFKLTGHYRRPVPQAEDANTAAKSSEAARAPAPQNGQ